jgi:hypothetical protein
MSDRFTINVRNGTALDDRLKDLRAGLSVQQAAVLCASPEKVRAYFADPNSLFPASNDFVYAYGGAKLRLVAGDKGFAFHSDDHAELMNSGVICTIEKYNPSTRSARVQHRLDHGYDPVRFATIDFLNAAHKFCNGFLVIPTGEGMDVIEWNQTYKKERKAPPIWEPKRY